MCLLDNEIHCITLSLRGNDVQELLRKNYDIYLIDFVPHLWYAMVV